MRFLLFLVVLVPVALTILWFLTAKARLRQARKREIAELEEENKIYDHWLERQMRRDRERLR